MNLEKIKAVNPGTYDMSMRGLRKILDYSKGDTSSGLIMAFQYGFVRGQNAEKARAKRKAVQA